MKVSEYTKALRAKKFKISGRMADQDKMKKLNQRMIDYMERSPKPRFSKGGFRRWEQEERVRKMGRPARNMEPMR